MKRPSLVVLDMGHGNAAVLLDSNGVVVVDAGKGGILLDFLRQAGIGQVDVLLISHADTDHIRNAPDLLLDDKIVVRRVCFNSDASKDTQRWEEFKIAIRYARRKKGLVAEPQLTTSQTGRLDCGCVRVEVLYPPPDVAAGGPGARCANGDTVTSNSMSAVIRLHTRHGPMVLLAGDAERGCLAEWAEEGTDPCAKILVFPHHGGIPGDDDSAGFAADLTQAVKPDVVIFSTHRSQYDLPRPEVVEAIRRYAPGVRVMCTQLSAHCVAPVPDVSRGHLSEYAAHGKPAGNCCAGTIVIDLNTDALECLPVAGQHLRFIQELGGNPLCLREVF
jgi:competence protein ComEC